MKGRNNVDFEVRAVNQTELQRVIQLWKSFMDDPSAIDKPLPTHEENTKKQAQFLQELIRQDPRQVLVADREGELIGYVAYEIEQKAPIEMQQKRSFVHDLYVEPDHRRTGVGRSLLQACLDVIKSAGPHQVRIAVWVRNGKAIELYRAMGFTDHLLVMRIETGN
jgi:ribosomal protein S18 acetylase RimI-like enzyme